MQLPPPQVFFVNGKADHSDIVGWTFLTHHFFLFFFFGLSSLSFLGAIDLKGTPYQSASIATGFGSHLAQPILRKELEQRGGEDNITEEQAVEILKKCMKVLWYRDARSMNKVWLRLSPLPHLLSLKFTGHRRTTVPNNDYFFHFRVFSSSNWQRSLRKV